MCVYLFARVITFVDVKNEIDYKNNSKATAFSLSHRIRCNRVVKISFLHFNPIAFSTFERWLNRNSLEKLFYFYEVMELK